MEPLPSDEEKLHLVAAVADEVAKQYGKKLKRFITPSDLMAEGWIGLKAAEQNWDGIRPFLPYARFRIKGEMENSFRTRKRWLTGQKDKDSKQSLDGMIREAAAPPPDKHAPEDTDAFWATVYDVLGDEDGELIDVHFWGG